MIVLRSPNEESWLSCGSCVAVSAEARVISTSVVVVLRRQKNWREQKSRTANRRIRSFAITSVSTGTAPDCGNASFISVVSDASPSCRTCCTDPRFYCRHVSPIVITSSKLAATDRMMTGSLRQEMLPLVQASDAISAPVALALASDAW